MEKYKLVVNSIDGKIEIDFNDIGIKNDLEQIDEFTSTMANSTYLAYYLLKNDFITKEQFLDEITMICEEKGEKHKLNIVYKDTLPYLKQDFLRERLTSLIKDNRFVKLFRSAFFVPGEDIRGALRDGIGHNYYYLRFMGTFIYKYDNVINKDEKGKNFEKRKRLRERLELLKLIESEDRKNSYNFTDDDSEPIFPPNSFEEEQFNLYMQKLDELWDQNKDPFDEVYKKNKR